MRRPLNPRILLLVVAMALAFSACTSQPEPSDPVSSDAATAETPKPKQSNDIFFYDPNECESPDADADADPFCNVRESDWACDVSEATVDYGSGQLTVGENANASLARTHFSSDTMLWHLTIFSLAEGMPSVYITLEEMPGNEFGYAYETPRLEWVDYTTSDLRMVGIRISDSEPGELATYNMEFVDEDGGELFVSVTFDC